MSDDEALRRLISNDLIATAGDDGEHEKVLAAVRAGRQRQGAWRVTSVLVALVGTLAALSMGYVLVAQVLPPFGASGAATLLWLPFGAIGVLVASAAWIASSALLQSRR